MHEQPSKYAGMTMKVKEGISHPQVSNFGGSEIKIEDWWDRVNGVSWMRSVGNPTALIYAMRTGMSPKKVPIDDEVLYGKIDGLGHLVHVSEIE